MSLPSSRTFPEFGVISPVIALNSVVLPAPLGPMSPVIRPGSTATWPPKRTVTSSTSSSAMQLHLAHVQHGVERAHVFGGERTGDADPLERRVVDFAFERLRLLEPLHDVGVGRSREEHDER